MSEILTYSRVDTIRIGVAVNELGKLVGGNVALVVVQEPSGRLAFMPHPDFATAVFQYLASVDWQDAIEGAEQAGLA